MEQQLMELLQQRDDILNNIKDKASTSCGRNMQEVIDEIRKLCNELEDTLES